MTPTLTPFPSATPSPTPNATERRRQFATQRDDYFAAIRSQTGLSDADIRDYFRMQALREKVRDAVITDVSRTAPFVDARHILVADEATAQTLLTALQNGELFASLAKVALDRRLRRRPAANWAGHRPATTSRNSLTRCATAEIGAIVGPVQSQFGYHIIQVRAREDREMSDTELRHRRKTRSSTQYLRDLRTADSDQRPDLRRVDEQRPDRTGLDPHALANLTEAGDQNGRPFHL